MSSTKGPPFTSPPIPPILRKWAAELNSAHPATWLPSGPSLGLVHRFFEETGRGTYVADGCFIAHGTRVAAYLGELTLHSTPTSLYSLELLTVRRNSRSYVPFVDASNHCKRGVTPTSHAGLFNHACEDPSCAATWLWLPQCTLPIMVCTTRRSLRRGSELTYNHDAHNPISAFTFGPEEAASLAPLGLTYGPCRCRHPAECPRQRFIPRQ
jgi:hypothetical protein